MKKLKYVLPLAAFITLCSFFIGDVLSEIHLNKEQLSDRLLKEFEDESPGAFLSVRLNESQSPFKLNVTQGQFKAIGDANYRSTLLQMKAEINQAIASPYFQQKWEAWLTSQGLNKALTIHDLAADNVKKVNSASMEENFQRETAMEDVKSIISSSTDEITDADSKLQTKGNPPGWIKARQEEKQAAINKLAEINTVAQSEAKGDDAFKSAYNNYKHSEDIMNEIASVDNELTAINTDMAGWQYGASPEHKKEVLTNKKMYDAKKQFYMQVLDKKKISPAAFNEAYRSFQSEKLVQDEMTRLTDADVISRIEKRNPYLRLKPILQRFLALTDGMDFKATLKIAGSYKVFANPALEERSTTWKFYFRRGEAFTGAARDISKQWISELK